MRKEASWWVTVVTTPLRLLRSILTPLYDVSFGWFEKQLAKKHEEKLMADVKLACQFLFNEEKGFIVPTLGVPFPPGFDYAFVTIAADNLIFRFSRGRGELGVNIAPAFAPDDWHDLSLVLGVVTAQSEIVRSKFRDLWEVSRVLRPQMQTLAQRLAKDQFNEVKLCLEKYVYRFERTAIQQSQTEIDSRLYGNRS